jgi:hypothetical protein
LSIVTATSRRPCEELDSGEMVCDIAASLEGEIWPSPSALMRANSFCISASSASDDTAEGLSSCWSCFSLVVDMAVERSWAIVDRVEVVVM